MSELPRLGFLGTGWIGRSRLASLAQSGLAEIAALCDADPVALHKASVIAPTAGCFDDLDGLLDVPLDGLVIATPSGSHAELCVRAFERGLAVFCQKPLGANAAEVGRVLEAARRANRRLDVDFCYRETAALRRLREVVRSGEVGRVFAMELVFHNAYGPDQAWSYDRRRAGGGCLIDLGVHLLDVAFWVLGEPTLREAATRLFAAGRLLEAPLVEVEDFASGQLVLSDDVSLSLACSWRSSFGAEARIEIACFGTQGGVAFSNVGGSFYDFACDRFHGATRERLVDPPDPWGGRALIRFARELAAAGSYRHQPRLLEVARALDALYSSAPRRPPLEIERLEPVSIA